MTNYTRAFSLLLWRSHPVERVVWTDCFHFILPPILPSQFWPQPFSVKENIWITGEFLVVKFKKHSSVSNHSWPLRGIWHDLLPSFQNPPLALPSRTPGLSSFSLFLIICVTQVPPLSSGPEWHSTHRTPPRDSSTHLVIHKSSSVPLAQVIFGPMLPTLCCVWHRDKPE